MKASDCVEVMRPLGSAIARTLIISFDEPPGWHKRRFGCQSIQKAAVFGVASSWNSQAIASEQSTTNAALINRKFPTVGAQQKHGRDIRLFNMHSLTSQPINLNNFFNPHVTYQPLAFRAPRALYLFAGPAS